MSRISDLLADGQTTSFEFFPPRSEEGDRRLRDPEGVVTEPRQGAAAQLRANLRTPLARPLLDPFFQAVAGGLQRRIPFLNLHEHLVEAVDQLPQLIVPALGGSQRVVLLGRHDLCNQRQVRDRFGDHPLQPGGQQEDHGADEARERVAEHRAAGVADVHRPGGVRGDELDVDPDASPEVGPAVVITCLDDRRQGGGELRLGQPEVDESRPGDLGPRYHPLGKLERGHDLIGDLARVGLAGSREHHGQVGGQIAMTRLPGTLQDELRPRRGLGCRHTGERPPDDLACEAAFLR